MHIENTPSPSDDDIERANSPSEARMELMQEQLEASKELEAECAKKKAEAEKGLSTIQKEIESSVIDRVAQENGKELRRNESGRVENSGDFEEFVRNTEPASRRLAFAQAFGLTSGNDCGHFCCPDDRPEIYTDKMKQLGLSEFVERGRDSYSIPPATFREALSKMIQDFATVEEKDRLEIQRGILENTSKHHQEVCETRDKVRTDLAEYNLIGDAKLSDSARAYLTDLMKDNPPKVVKVVDEDTILAVTHRSEWGGSGGIAYFSQLRIFSGGQADLQEWQWRDRYDASRDKPWLSISEIGEVKSKREGNKLTLDIELLNSKDGSRSTRCELEISQQPVEKVSLTKEQQELFESKVKAEQKSIMQRLNELWECKPHMPDRHPTGLLYGNAGTGYGPYDRPELKETVNRLEAGVAAFVTVEQIDHRATDPQTRYEVWVLRDDWEKPKRAAEDHAYEKSQGCPVMAVLSLSRETIEVNGREGRKTIQLDEL